MGGGAWPFLVGGAICLVNSVNERDLGLLNSYADPAIQNPVAESWSRPDGREGGNPLPPAGDRGPFPSGGRVGGHAS
jgi:hypothetical protein